MSPNTQNQDFEREEDPNFQTLGNEEANFNQNNLAQP